MNYQQACQILGISPGTDFRDIKKKYRKLMSALHPDVHISARSRYHYNVQEINIAYALLKEASLKDSGALLLWRRSGRTGHRRFLHCQGKIFLADGGRISPVPAQYPAMQQRTAG